MNSSFKFLEISSRCFGRLDIKYGMDKEPFDDKRLKEHPPFLPLIQSLLGEDAELRYSGLITSYPGSSDQPFHGDDGYSQSADLHFQLHHTQQRGSFQVSDFA